MKYLHLVKEKLYNYFLRILPLQDKVVFCNFFGRGLGDDPKYIALALKKINPKIKLYWVTDGKWNIKLSSGIFPLKLWSREYFYHMATSKVWVLNIKNMPKPAKKSKQLYIQTWHASISLKQVEKDVERSLNPDYVKATQADSHLIDLMYANNDFQLNKYKTVYWYNGRVLKCDVPREAVLLNPPLGLKTKILSKYGIDDDAKIVLYAPTFRKGVADIGVYSWNYLKVVDALERKFEGKFVLFLRLHPNIANLAKDIHYDGNVIPVTNYPDMQELLSVSDVMINDYSSSMFEFGLLLKRPVFLLAKDLEEYTSSDRTLEFSLDELPFPLSVSEEELLDKIGKFEELSYIEKLERFNRKINMMDSGTGDSYVANIINNYVTKGKIDELEIKNN